MDNHTSSLVRFNKYYIPEPNSGCWLWLNHLTDGYGLIRVNGKKMGAHRFSYEIFIGPIPNTLQIDHLCRVRSCVNPKHLRLVTQQDNILCGNGLAALEARQTHCVYGHDFDFFSTGRRYCKICAKIRMAKFRAKHDIKS